ncbi:MAG: sn-glycerol-3-phosphate ABC transporter ATP-binding protein UgpC [Pirellulales bacterium]|nr:sn-glycerol-3-phosphate ABC transporter ATP-binding protein UgpC [Pirellulales bacterium]
MASVTLEQVSKVYPGDVYAVRQIDLEIQDGEFLVLVGPSGCGKSTTLRMIAGLETISGGTLKIGGAVVNDLHPKDRDIAMVFQNYALYPHMTVRQNMSFALKMRKVAKAEIKERVEWAADMLDLKMLLGRKPKALSGGQRQRVALGRAIVRQPAVFLFDEPLSNLDAKLRVETRAEIKRLHRKLGTTTIYVTHDQEEAMTLGDRVALMCDGLVRQIDTPLNIYQQPADRFVAGFMGMPPMNFLEGQLTRQHDTVCFTTGDACFRLDEAPGEWLAGEAQREVIAGIRPEHITLSVSPLIENGTADSLGPGIAASVQGIEPLGSTMDVTILTTDGNRLVCRVPAAAMSEGRAITARVAPQHIHLFEPNTPGDADAPVRYGRSLR